MQPLRSLARAAAGLAALTCGCAAGSYHDAAVKLQTRNPHAALEYAALCLQTDPEYAEGHQLVSEKLLKMIAQEHEHKVEAMRAAGNFEGAVADCDRVAASAYVALTIPGSSYQIYHEEHRAELAGHAAEKFYQLGLEMTEQGRAKDSALAFRRSLGFRPNYKDADARYRGALAEAKTYLFMVSTGGPDPEAVRIVMDGIPSAAAQRGLAFLEFTRDASRSNARCIVRVEDGTFHDSGWQAQAGQNEVMVAKRDAKGRVIKDKQGKTVQEKKRASWTVYSRDVSYRFRVGFSVEASGDDAPRPAHSTGNDQSDSAEYAQWRGDAEAVPMRVRSLPSSPRQLRTRSDMARAAASACVDELAHQLFLAYEK